MANSTLINRKFVIPKQMIYYFQTKVPRVAIQVQNFLNKGHINYYDMKNFVRDYPTLSDQEKIEHGGEVFYKWVNGLLERLRNVVKNSKYNKTMMGKSNAFIKPHEKTPTRHGHTPQKKLN